MNERICAGYNGLCPKQQQLGRLNRTGICSICYARKKYAEKYSAAAKGKKPKTPKVKKLRQLNPTPEQIPAPLQLEAIAPLMPGWPATTEGKCGAATSERVITIQLGESKVQKLLDLLLQ